MIDRIETVPLSGRRANYRIVAEHNGPTCERDNMPHRWSLTVTVFTRTNIYRKVPYGKPFYTAGEAINYALGWISKYETDVSDLAKQVYGEIAIDWNGAPCATFADLQSLCDANAYVESIYAEFGPYFVNDVLAAVDRLLAANYQNQES
jgi:hypothetical protein